MKGVRIFIIAQLTLMQVGRGQTYFKVDPDSVRVIDGELLMANHTRNVHGVLINVGDGVTVFQRLRLVNVGDSALAIAGQDTLDFASMNHEALGHYYVVSNPISMVPGYYYHPVAFESTLDSGQMYHVHAVLYVRTGGSFDESWLFRVQYSDTTLRERPSLHTLLNTGDSTRVYSVEYDKVVQSRHINDTLRMAFYTNPENPNGLLQMDSLSFMHVKPFTPMTITP